MSESFTESFADDGKLRLCVAENGHSFEFECSETTSVESVMRFVESVSGIGFSDQLLLSLDMKLEPQKLFSAFGLPASDREVFFFCGLKASLWQCFRRRIRDLLSCGLLLILYKPTWSHT